MLFHIRERDAVPGQPYEVQGVPNVGLLPGGLSGGASPTAVSWAALLSEAGPQFQALAQRKAVHGAQLLQPRSLMSITVPGIFAGLQAFQIEQQHVHLPVSDNRVQEAPASVLAGLLNSGGGPHQQCCFCVAGWPARSSRIFAAVGGVSLQDSSRSRLLRPVAAKETSCLHVTLACDPPGQHHLGP